MISAVSITMRYGEKTLFEDVSVKFRSGNRYGLIGANGSGKSTFMKILSGQLEPSSGEVALDSGCTMGYLRQDHNTFDHQSVMDTVYQGNEKLWKLHLEREHLYTAAELTPEEEERIGHIEDEFGEAGGYTMETDAAKLLIGLGIPEDSHEAQMSEMAAGLKFRVLLARVLFGTPDVLLLDEPTNYLDMTSRDWLETFLQQYVGTVIVISHDRYFLNAVSTHTADLDYQEIRMFTGNYDEFMETNAMLLEKRQRENATKEKRIQELQTFINRFSANASKAKQATSRQKEMEKIEVNKMKPTSRVSPYLRFEPRERLGDKVFECEGIGHTYDAPLFSDFDAIIGPNEKIAIIGNNGVGKTTLLRILCGELKPTSGTVRRGDTVDISIFPQDPMTKLVAGRQAMDWLAKYCTDEQQKETELRSAMGGMLFRGDAVFKPCEVLSGGEKARLILASMIMSGGNVLALDEPTNHLDLESIESLNYAISLFENTVLFVSHDREFIQSLATRIFDIRDGQIVDYPGTLKEYEAWKVQQAK
ncbi:MAG: ATP-binding cassette domain-containing protein [Kiritimatiellae bacterium]|nr:ATP-binding cassette domain-containing protein [Kiritimatiellia bacterium]